MLSKLFKTTVSNTSNRKKAFTLIELLFTIAIISLLSSLILNNLSSAKMKTNDTKISEDLRQFKTAVDLYYNDNKTYPPIAANYKSKNFSINDSQYSWSGKLAFFIKKAEAAVVHSTPLCDNFDKIAASLVSRKYLANIPIHPYDNDTKGICYKAVNTGNTLSVYASLTTVMNIGSGSSAGTISKRTGFITGDTSPAGISDLSVMTNNVDQNETPYPVGLDATTSLDISKSADAVYGVTTGISGSTGTGNIINNTSSNLGYNFNVVNLNPLNGSFSYTPLKSQYLPGDVITVTAVPNTYYIISSWVGCTSYFGTVCTVTMGSSDVTVYFNIGFQLIRGTGTPLGGTGGGAGNPIPNGGGWSF